MATVAIESGTSVRKAAQERIIGFANEDEYRTTMLPTWKYLLRRALEHYLNRRFDLALKTLNRRN